jgi:hypothetical protein
MRGRPIGEALERTLPPALRQRLALHARLLERVRSVLPEALGNQCSDCVVNAQGQAVIYVRNAACATQVRFYGERLLDALRGGDFPLLRQVLVRIHPEAGRSGRLIAPVPGSAGR